eukprot:686375-Prymnesium_polylepis.1
MDDCLLGHALLKLVEQLGGRAAHGLAQRLLATRLRLLAALDGLLLVCALLEALPAQHMAPC